MERVTVKPLGFFAEFKSSWRDEPRVRDGVRADPQPDEARLVAYLRAGRSQAFTATRKNDVLRSDWFLLPDDAGFLMTDGTWMWPSELAYYVERYHVRLPDEFAAWVRARDFIAPELPTDVTYVLADWKPTPPAPTPAAG